MAAAALRVALWGLLLLPRLISAEEGILHAYNSDNPLLKKEYCMYYNSEQISLPSSLSSATSRKLVVLTPKLLCNSSDVPRDTVMDKAVAVMRGNCTFKEKAQIAQNLGAKMLLIASKTNLFTPGFEGMHTNLYIPIALVSYEDILDISKNLGRNVSVALYELPLPVFEFSIVIIFLIAVLTVAAGGYWSGMDELEELKASASNESIAVSRTNSDTLVFSTVEIVIFVVMSCVMLVLLYFFFLWLVYVVIALFCMGSAISLYNCLAALISKIPFGRCSVPCYKTTCEVRLIILFGFCVATAAVWVVFRNEERWVWVLQDILGIAFCVNFMRTVKVPNFKSCVLLLGLLLVYDVFFVFITPYFTKNGESIMVEVAKGPSADSEKSFGILMEASAERSVPHEKLPVVMKVPKLRFCGPEICKLPFSLLGYGDIILPGFLVAYCHRFDVQTGSPSVYFISSTIAYAVGMLVTFMALLIMQLAQPALLYLVPFTVITCALVAWRRKEMKKFWNGNGYQVMNPVDSAASEENTILPSEQCGE